VKKKVPCLSLRNSSCICGILKWVHKRIMYCVVAILDGIFFCSYGTYVRGDQGLFKLVTLNCILNRITGVTFGC
jgi:hypothetical protein